MESGARLVIWKDGSAFHKDMPLVATAGAGRVFAHERTNVQGGMINQRADLGGGGRVMATTH